MLVAVSSAHDTATNTEWQLPEVTLYMFRAHRAQHQERQIVLTIWRLTATLVVVPHR
jgi:hypothetical protein